MGGEYEDEFEFEYDFNKESILTNESFVFMEAIDQLGQHRWKKPVNEANPRNCAFAQS